VVEKGDLTVEDIPVHPLVCWQRVEKLEILGVRVIKELLEDEKINGKGN
jgi:hypothetical protein